MIVRLISSLGNQDCRDMEFDLKDAEIPYTLNPDGQGLPAIRSWRLE